MKKETNIKYNTRIVEPLASALVETLRAIGYSHETAVADVMDNSITAGATQIYFESKWRGGESYISIRDNGCGMDEHELIEGLRPGSMNPLEEREAHDLGRFGLGLKTASFSQCRCLSVMSKKKDGESCFFSWDLDHVQRSKKWEIIQYIPDEFKHALDDQASGTLVVWTKMDRIVPAKIDINNDAVKKKFRKIGNKIREHLQMTFHRFIDEKSNPIEFYCWGNRIDGWDPFMADKSQKRPGEYLSSGKVFVKGYILPHKSRLSQDEYDNTAGTSGWNAQQGFYVYRNKRLLLSGTWLGLFPIKDEAYKLARISVDLPNNLDHVWQIDIKKSRARIPHDCMEQLKAYANGVREAACEVFRHRGRLVQKRRNVAYQPLWIEKKSGSVYEHRINREHDFIRLCIEKAKTNPKQAIENIIKLIERSLPKQSIYVRIAQMQDTESMKKDLTKADLNLAQSLYKGYLDEGLLQEEAKVKLIATEPFLDYPELYYILGNEN